MKVLRRIHLYLGCLFAPLLLMFVITGCYQTLHLDRQKDPGKVSNLMAKLSAIHVDQILPAANVETYSPAPFRWLVVAGAVAMAVTVLLGVYLAFRTLRPRWLAALMLLIGVIGPVVLLILGHS